MHFEVRGAPRSAYLHCIELNKKVNQFMVNYPELNEIKGFVPLLRVGTQGIFSHDFRFLSQRGRKTLSEPQSSFFPSGSSSAWSNSSRSWLLRFSSHLSCSRRFWDSLHGWINFLTIFWISSRNSSDQAYTMTIATKRNPQIYFSIPSLYRITCGESTSVRSGQT